MCIAEQLQLELDAIGVNAFGGQERDSHGSQNINIEKVKQILKENNLAVPDEVSFESRGKTSKKRQAARSKVPFKNEKHGPKAGRIKTTQFASNEIQKTQIHSLKIDIGNIISEK